MLCRGTNPVVVAYRRRSLSGLTLTFTPAISCQVDKIQYTWNMEDPVDVQLEHQTPIWMVRRDVFDHFIVQQAQKQGAELRDNTEVTGIEFKVDRWHVNTKNGPIEGKYLIAADGAKGKMANWLGFKDRKRRLAGALEVEAPAENVAPVINFEFGLVKNGYIWNFPKADGYSIGIGTFRGGESQDFKKILDTYAKGSFGVDINSFKQYGHPLVSLGWRSKTPYPKCSPSWGSGLCRRSHDG